MSTTIDERVVSLQFDNKQFENNVQTTMSTLDKLKQSLKLKGSAKAAQSEFAAYESGAFKFKDSLLKAFSSLEYEIGNRMKGIIKWLNPKTAVLELVNKEIQSATAGLKEYETQMGAIQTIVANTEKENVGLTDAEKIQKVNGYLDELNTYADKTIYNFTEMTKNIGTFTAAGVDLDTSVASIKGIANLAAVSGSTSQQASTAMYQLSQAMASGTVKLMDWNSVVNAGMGGQVFQDALKTTAKVHGVEIDKIIEKQGSFRESLSEGWLTTEILTETLQNFTLTVEGAEKGTKEYQEKWDALKKSLTDKGYTAEQAEAILKMGENATSAATEVKTFTQLFDTLKESAQSGWAQTWELIIGDFNEAKEFLSNLSDIFGGVIGKSADARNELLGNWKALGGRDDLVQSIYNIIEAISRLVKPIKEAFQEMIPPLTGEKLAAFTKGLKELTEKLKMGSENSDKLKRTFKGVFAIVKIGINIIKGLWGALKKVVAAIGFGELGGGLLDITANLGDWLVHVAECIDSSKTLGKVFEFVGNGLAFVVKIIKGAVGLIGETLIVPQFNGLKTLLDLFKMVGTSAEESFSNAGNAFDKLGDWFVNSGLYMGLKTALELIKTVGGAISKIFVKLVGGLANAFAEADFDTIIGFLNAIAKGGIAVGLLQIGKYLGLFGTNFENLIPSIKDFMDTLKGQAESKGEEESFGKKLLMIAGAIAILVAAMWLLSTIDSDKLVMALAGVTALFVELFIMLKFAAKTKRFDKTIAYVGTVAMKLAGAILIMALALKLISTLSWEQMAIGLVGVTATLMVLAGVLAVLSLPVFSKGIPKNTASQMIKISAALLVVAGVLKVLATLSWEDLARGMAAMGGALVLMTSVLAILTAVDAKCKNVHDPAKQMLLMSESLVLIALSLKVLATMNWADIGKALTAMTAALAVMTIVVAISSKCAGGGANMLLMAEGILVLTAAMTVLSLLSWEGILKGLVAIAGAFTIIGVAALLLSPIITVVYALATSLLFIGTAVLAAGAGMLLFGAGLALIAANIMILGASIGVIAEVIPVVIAALVSGAIIGLGMGIIAICKIIVESTETICEAFVSIIAAACMALKDSVDMITDTVLGMILDVLTALAQYAGPIVAVLIEVVIDIIDALASKMQPLVDAVVNLFGALIKAVVQSLSGMNSDALLEAALAVAGLYVMMAALAGMVSLTPMAMAGVLAMTAVLVELSAMLALFGLINKIPGLEEMISDGGNLLETIGVAIGKFAGGLVGGSLEAMAKCLSGIDAASLEGAKTLVGIMAALTAVDLLEKLKNFLFMSGESSLERFAREIPLLGEGVAKFSEAVDGKVNNTAVTAAAEAAKTLSDFMESLPKTGGLMGLLTGNQDLGAFGEKLVPLGTGIAGFSTAVKDVDPAAVTAAALAAKQLAKMTQEIPSSEGMMAWFSGEKSIAGFGDQLPLLGIGLAGFAEAVQNVDPLAVAAAALAAKELAKMTQEIPSSEGMVQWFTGEQSISKFAAELPRLGRGISGFSQNVAGVNPVVVTAAALAAKELAKMTQEIPNSGGVVAWFAGDNSISRFARELPTLGEGLNGFSTAVKDINPVAVTAAAKAAEAIAKMTEHVPKEDGVTQWFTGTASLSKYATDMEGLGKGVASFEKAVGGDKPVSPESVQAGVNAAIAIAELSKHVPKSGGFAQWFTGEQDLGDFANKMPSLGKGLKSFSNNVAGINAENVTAGANAAKTLGEMADILPNKDDLKRISTFGEKLPSLGKNLKSCFAEISAISNGTMSNATAAINSIKDVSNINADGINAVSNAIDKLKDSVKNLASEVKDDLTKAGKKAIEGFVNGIKDNLSSVEKACEDLVDAGKPDISTKGGAFYNAGRDLVSGFANGISENSYKAEAKAKAMAAAAAAAAKRELDEHSPSKVGYGIGNFFGIAFVNGIGDNVKNAYNISTDMAKSAKSGLTSAISKINDLITNDIDSQPTIRPVLDLSDVQSGANAIGSIFGSGAAVGVMANIGSISSAMNKRGQNGGNADVISAIDKLRKDIGNINNNTYTIGGITYDDGSNVSDAVKSLIRATRIERRV